jgi:hypothetical protein
MAGAPQPAQAQGGHAVTHDDFVAAFRAGRVRAIVDRRAAARYVSARMLLPVVLLPVFGIGVALALVGHYVWGLVVFLLAFAFRALVRGSSQGFVVTRALEDPRFYGEACAAGLLRVEAVRDDEEAPIAS